MYKRYIENVKTTQKGKTSGLCTVNAYHPNNVSDSHGENVSVSLGQMLHQIKLGLVSRM